MVSAARSGDVVVLRKGAQRSGQCEVVGELRIGLAEARLLHQPVAIGERGVEQVPARRGEDAQAGGQRVDIDLVVVEQIGDQVRADDAAVAGLDQHASPELALDGQRPGPHLRQAVRFLSLPPVHVGVIGKGGVDEGWLGRRRHALAELEDRLDAAGLIGKGQDLREALEVSRAAHRLDRGVAGAAGKPHDGLAHCVPGQAEARAEASVPARRDRVAAEPSRAGSAED